MIVDTRPALWRWPFAAALLSLEGAATHDDPRRVRRHVFEQRFVCERCGLSREVIVGLGAATCRPRRATP